MIEYLKHHEIDREIWDSCIRASGCLKPYPYSWYLDIMAPGWEALVDDDYDSVFPLPCSSRFGISYVATPVFLQQLGAYSPDKPVEKAVREFLEYIPLSYRLIDLCIGQKINGGEFGVTERSNYVLDLSCSYNELFSNFSPDCRRVINLTSKRKFDIVNDISPGEIIGLFRSNQGKNIKGIRDRDYYRLNDLMSYCLRSNKGAITGIRGKKKELIYAVFQIRIPRTITLLFIAGTHEGREQKVSHYVINDIIRNNASTNTVLDFAGSSLPPVARFIESFGGRNIPYYRLYRNNLFWPVRMLK
jgi:hypothetical protein